VVNSSECRCARHAWFPWVTRAFGQPTQAMNYAPTRRRSRAQGLLPRRRIRRRGLWTIAGGGSFRRFGYPPHSRAAVFGLSYFARPAIRLVLFTVTLPPCVFPPSA